MTSNPPPVETPRSMCCESRGGGIHAETPPPSTSGTPAVKRPQLVWVPLTQWRRRKTTCIVLGGFVRFFFLFVCLFRCVLNTRAYFQTAHGWSAERDQAGPVCRPRPRQLPEEDPSPARWRSQASGKCGSGSAPRPALNMRAPGTQLREDTAASGKLEKSTELGRMALWGKKKPTSSLGVHLGLGLRSPISQHFSRFSKQKQKRGRKTKKRKAHILWEKKVFFTHRKTAGAPPVTAPAL